MVFMSFGAVLGVIAGLFGHPLVLAAASVCAHIFKSLLEFVSVPIIFLSIVATITSMDGFADVMHIGSRVVRYTISTTLAAAGVALGLFHLINPVRSHVALAPSDVSVASTGYSDFFLSIVPSNLIDALSSNGNVASVVFIAILLSAAILTLPGEQRRVLHRFFEAFFHAFLAVTRFVMYLMPIGVWAFVTQFVVSILQQNTNLHAIWLYIVTIVAANLVQAGIVLPLFLLFKGLSPLRLLRAFRPALAVAFFSKSSNAALPLTITCARERAKIAPSVANFTLPLCATINMNGCAAFILITVLFVGGMHGMTFGLLESCAWIVLATIAAVGNAGVPMGCFFLASAFLAHLKLPLELMGVILPLYALIDMIETAVNVWSDSCVAAIVDSEITPSE